MDGGEYILYVGTHGDEDPTRAGLLFSAALAARRNGMAAHVALLGDAVYLLNDKIASETKPMGRATVQQLIAQTQEKEPKYPDLKIVIHC